MGDYVPAFLRDIFVRRAQIEPTPQQQQQPQRPPILERDEIYREKKSGMEQHINNIFDNPELYRQLGGQIRRLQNEVEELDIAYREDMIMTQPEREGAASSYDDLDRDALA